MRATRMSSSAASMAASGFSARVTWARTTTNMTIITDVTTTMTATGVTTRLSRWWAARSTDTGPLRLKANAVM